VKSSYSRTIPFLDLVAPHEELKAELCDVFQQALETGGFVGGPEVKAFETEFAQYCGAQYCVGVGSGTDALTFALVAAGMKLGDVVVTVPNTFIATVEAISQAGGQPDFVDIDEQTYNMDVARLEEYLERECVVDQENGGVINRRLRKRVTAIIPVHLYGQPANIDPILKLAEKYQLVVIEDACQAHGAAYYSARDLRWNRAGSMGKAAAFSFYPGKNLGACGEGGAVITNDEGFARLVQMLRDHGQSRKYYHEVEGYNGRLDAIQAGILRVKLKHLETWNEKRRDAARRYQELFRGADEEVTLPHEPWWAQGVYHLYVVRVHDRDILQNRLTGEQIGTGIHYPVPLHLQEACRKLGYKKGAFPVAERVSVELLSLPMFPQITEEQQYRVVQAILDFTRETVAGVEAGKQKYVSTVG
jgi:dTDP-4-amino-4,6-dideoxygalactose transaminase